MLKFYETYGDPQDVTLYREVLLLDSEDTVQKIRQIRLPHWALCALRVKQVPADEAALLADEDAHLLPTIANSGDRKHMRYDRLILLKRGPSDEVDSTIATLRKFCPSFIQQRRLFLTEYAGPITQARFHRAIGAASPIE